MSSQHKQPIPFKLLERCRQLRRNATDPEQFMWQLLRGRQLGGAKFRRQHPLGGYILDFYCHELKLAIELDGSGHLEAEQVRYDLQRDKQLNEHGIQVLRFWNDQVLNDPEGVLSEIYETLMRLSPKI